LQSLPRNRSVSTLSSTRPLPTPNSTHVCEWVGWVDHPLHLARLPSCPAPHLALLTQELGIQEADARPHGRGQAKTDYLWLALSTQVRAGSERSLCGPRPNNCARA